MAVTHQAPLFEGFSREDTGVRCHFLQQGIFPTQGSNLVSCIAVRLSEPPGKPFSIPLIYLQDTLKLQGKSLAFHDVSL